MLLEAWKRVKANKGSSGIDGICIEEVETEGVEKYLEKIQTEFKQGNYRPSRSWNKSGLGDITALRWKAIR